MSEERRANTQSDAGTHERERFVQNALEAAIRIALLFGLAAWCFSIIKPFVSSIIWGIVMAVALHPAYVRFCRAIGDRTRLATVLMTVLVLVAIGIPSYFMSGTLIDGGRALAAQLREGSLEIPTADARIKEWPVIGDTLFQFWELASTNLREAVSQIQPQLRAVGEWLVRALASVGIAMTQILFAIVIAGILLPRGQAGAKLAHSLATRLIGERGPALADMASATVRSVTKGILGVAVIQGILAGFGLLVAGVPAAGLWALLCLVLAIIQIGPTPILIPAAIYVFATKSTIVAILFALWCVFVGVIDNVLKPLLLGRGIDVPMWVIFIGTIGGFVSMGIIGLFLGSIVLVLGYTLFKAWLETRAPEAESGKGERISQPT